MKVLAYGNESDRFVCPKCGEKIHLNTEKIDEIISSINNIQDTINGTKLIIDNIIKISSINSVNIQLKIVNSTLNTINEDINKNVGKLKNLLNENLDNTSITKTKNIIEGELEIKLNEINNNIILFNTDMNEEIDVYINNRKINMIKDGTKWKIDYNFQNDGNYKFKIILNANITDLSEFLKIVVI